MEDVDGKLIDEMCELRIEHGKAVVLHTLCCCLYVCTGRLLFSSDLIDIAGSTFSADSDSSDGFFIVPMPECFDVSKPLPQHDPEAAEQDGQDVPTAVAFTDPSALSQQLVVVESESTAANMTTGHVDHLENEEESNSQSELAEGRADEPLPSVRIRFPPPYESPTNMASLTVEIASAPLETSVHEDAHPEEHVPSAPPAHSPQPHFMVPKSQFVLPASRYVPPVSNWQPPQPTSPLDQLIEMGFGDRKRNAELLEEHSNDVQLVVQQLLKDTDNDWTVRRH